MLASIPPMEGAENVTAAVLEEIWNLLADETRAELRAFDGSRADWLASHHPSWSLVGRVVFHLAENKGDEARPFAFLATYTDRIRAKAGKARPRHLPMMVKYQLRPVCPAPLPWRGPPGRQRPPTKTSSTPLPRFEPGGHSRDNGRAWGIISGS